MNIKITKNTQYRRDYEREIKPGEIHEVARVGSTVMHPKKKQYFFSVDGRERMVLEGDCVVLPLGEGE